MDCAGAGGFRRVAAWAAVAGGLFIRQYQYFTITRAGTRNKPSIAIDVNATLSGHDPCAGTDLSRSRSDTPQCAGEHRSGFSSSDLNSTYGVGRFVKLQE